MVYFLSRRAVKFPPSFVSHADGLARASLSQNQVTGEYENMKVLCKVLHLFRLDVLLLGLLEKLVNGLSKKHAALKLAFECSLCCHADRND